MNYPVFILLLILISMPNAPAFAGEVSVKELADLSPSYYVVNQIEETLKQSKPLNLVSFYDGFAKAAEKHKWQEVNLARAKEIDNKAVAAIEILRNVSAKIYDKGNPSCIITRLNQQLERSLGLTGNFSQATPEQTYVVMRALIQMGQQRAQSPQKKQPKQWISTFIADRNYGKLDFTTRQDIYLKTFIAYEAQESAKGFVNIMQEVGDAYYFDDSIIPLSAELQEILKNFQGYAGISLTKPQIIGLEEAKFSLDLLRKDQKRENQEGAKNMRINFSTTSSIAEIVITIGSFLDKRSLARMATVSTSTQSALKQYSFYNLVRLSRNTNFEDIASLADPRLPAIAYFLSPEDAYYMRAIFAEIMLGNGIWKVRDLYTQAISAGSELAIFRSKDLMHRVTEDFGFVGKEGREYLEGLVNKGYERFRELLNEAAYCGLLDFTTVQARREYLEGRAKAGDRNAQKYLNRAAFFGKLGFTEDQERRECLEGRAKAGDRNAQKYLNKAAYEGLLGFTEYQERRECLEGRAKAGDRNAQEWLNEAAYDSKLGFTEDQERREYLEDRVKAGDRNTQKYLNRAAFFGKLGFTEVQVRKKYLEDRAKAGDRNAQEWLNEAVFFGNLGFTTAVQVRKKYLEDRAKAGDRNAQEYLNKAAYRGELDFTEDQARREYLEDRAKAGDRNAQEYLNKAAYEGLLGFTEDQARREYLGNRVKIGDRHAKELFVRAIANCHRGFIAAENRRVLKLYNILREFRRIFSDYRNSV